MLSKLFINLTKNNDTLLLIFLLLILAFSGCIKRKDLIKQNNNLIADKIALENKIKLLAAECEAQKTSLNLAHETKIKEINAQSAKDISEIKVREEKKNIIIQLPDRLLFKMGSARIRNEMLPLLHLFAGYIKNFPDQMVLVKGHACSLPIHNKFYESNWDLSSKRANEVIKYLIEKEKLPADQFCSVGMGEFHPNTNDKDNRRVEILILSKELSNDLKK